MSEVRVSCTVSKQLKKEINRQVLRTCLVGNNNNKTLKMCRLFCVIFSPQLMLEAQNRRIDDLLERIRLQQEKLDKQNVRIRTLQSQVRRRLRTTNAHVPVFNFAISSFKKKIS